MIPIDNTLVDHAGKLIEDVGYFWDHAEQRHKIAHDYLIANYVCPSGKHYALEFRRFRKRDDCEAERARVGGPTRGRCGGDRAAQRLATFKSHTVLCCELMDWVVDAADSRARLRLTATSPMRPICNHIAGQRAPMWGI